jgi:hypothetical protein
MWRPNFGYHFARLEGDCWRRGYQVMLPLIVRQPAHPPRALPLSVFAYSNEDSVPEQVRSIRSFLRYAGRPASFTIISDGSHSTSSIRLLERIDPVVSVRPSGDFLPSGLPERFRDYVASHPLGKQLGLIMSLPISGPALYADSDVLFFPGASELMRFVATPNVSAFYLPDCQAGSADPRIFRDPQEELDPVNTGLLLVFQKLDWSLGIRRYLDLKSEPTFFTNQTITHLTMHANGARPLDSREFVLQLDDQFVYPDRYASRDIILRHYVNPVRHKFWTTHLG